MKEMSKEKKRVLISNLPHNIIEVPVGMSSSYYVSYATTRPIYYRSRRAFIAHGAVRNLTQWLDELSIDSYFRVNRIGRRVVIMRRSYLNDLTPDELSYLQSRFNYRDVTAEPVRRQPTYNPHPIWSPSEEFEPGSDEAEDVWDSEPAEALTHSRAYYERALRSAERSIRNATEEEPEF